MDADKNKILVKKYLDAYNYFDVESMISLLHERIKFISIYNYETEIETNGLKDFVEYVEKNNKIHYSRKQTIRNINLENDKIIVELQYTILDENDIKATKISVEDIELFGSIKFGFTGNKIISIVDERHDSK